MRKKIIILGSTGSMGTQTLDVIRANPDDFEIVGLATRSNEKIKDQVAEFKPKYGGVLTREEAEEMVTQKDVDVVVVACRGADWTPVVLAAINAGKKIAMGNKEMIVEHGETIMKTVRENNADFIPVDSEHSGIFQCLQGRNKSDIEKVVLTCSGGPFWNREKLDDVTLEEALDHPTWKMGKKITVDSATLMNKSLEIIEAKYLFDLDPEQIEVLIHPQCIVHAIVYFKDGSNIAHMGYPDMSLPISYALYYPNAKKNELPRIDLANQKLEFYEPDAKKFPSLQFAYDVLSRKGNLPQKLNQANEEAVEKFFNREISFKEIFVHIQNSTF
ncbi:1-deoxy-D-xylulose-5-phosphate reductoisomerase [Patescibacteria group bacterium]